MSEVFCLDCDRKIKLPANAQEGDSITCTNCDAEFEIVSINPPKIEWMYDEYDDSDDWDDDDYDDDSDDNDDYEFDDEYDEDDRR